MLSYLTWSSLDIKKTLLRFGPIRGDALHDRVVYFTICLFYFPNVLFEKNSHVSRVTVVLGVGGRMPLIVTK